MTTTQSYLSPTQPRAATTPLPTLHIGYHVGHCVSHFVLRSFRRNTDTQIQKHAIKQILQEPIVT